MGICQVLVSLRVKGESEFQLILLSSEGDRRVVTVWDGFLSSGGFLS